MANTILLNNQESSNSRYIPSQASKRDNLSALLDGILIFCVTLYAWNQSHFQFNLYWQSESATQVLIVILITACILGALMGVLQIISKQLFVLVITYVIICLIYAALSKIGNDISYLFYLKAIVITLVMIWIIRDYRRIKFILWLNFLLGFTLILLNSVTILHWLDLINLSYESVPRVGGEKDLYHLDPYHFGFFGLTENYVYPGSYFGTARLQGWSSEPLHWSYFVLLTFSCAAMLISIYRNTIIRSLLVVSMFVIGIHIFFMQSSTIIISVWAIVLTVMAFKIIKWLKISDNKITHLIFFVMVIVPGLLIPFFLATVPGVYDIFLQDTVFGEGDNWETKLIFLTLGSDLYYHFLPSPSSFDLTTHNLILEKYLVAGYFLLAPLLWFIYKYLKYIGNKSSWMVVATITVVIAHTLTIPTQFFYPSGAMWFFIIAGLASFKRTNNLPIINKVILNV